MKHCTVLVKISCYKVMPTLMVEVKRNSHSQQEDITSHKPGSQVASYRKRRDKHYE